MKLTELNPRWVGHGGEGVLDRNRNPIPWREGVGISFDCPCGEKGDRVFVHLKNPMDGGPPLQPATTWEREGDSFETLTLRPSIQRMDGCRWHGYVTAGEVTTC